MEKCADTPLRFEFVTYADASVRELGLPCRGTGCSAGYDFTAYNDIVIPARDRVCIPTFIKVVMPCDMFLSLHIRSSIGMRRGIIITNATGIVDADYANNPDNEGCIMAALWNTTDKEQIIRKGERYMQGIFQRYYIADTETVLTSKRCGGIGSTDKSETF